ncbi:YciI family protein, partial [Streptomyces brasiliscabiei]|uniref:YciI family protein n=1 Tax=Streptomyces brasiliscabiei TaxID=2736302 RepID=UPI0038F643DB
MSDFLFIYRGGDASTSREQMQKTMEVWMAWFKELGASGCIKEIGNPLEADGKVVISNKSVTDGPYAETKDVIGGYTMI